MYLCSEFAPFVVGEDILFVVHKEHLVIVAERADCEADGQRLEGDGVNADGREVYGFHELIRCMWPIREPPRARSVRTVRRGVRSR